ncbi:MAG: creatininase family protein [Gaiellales bacterium]
MKGVQLELMTTAGVIAGGYTTAIMPMGACESHGDHMPLGTDGLTSHALAVRIAEQLERTLVLPPNFLGMSGHYRHKPMAISLSADTQTRVIADVLESLHHWGVHNVLLLNAHDGNIPSIEIAGRDAKIAHPEMSIATIDWWVVTNQRIPAGTFDVWEGWGHAGEAETSLGLALFPDLMQMEHARGQVPTTDASVREFWLFEELTSEGASGAPRHATTAKGEAIVSTVVDYMVEYMRRFEAHGLSYDPKDEPPV